MVAITLLFSTRFFYKQLGCEGLRLKNGPNIKQLFSIFPS